MRDGCAHGAGVWAGQGETGGTAAEDGGARLALAGAGGGTASGVGGDSQCGAPVCWRAVCG